MPKDRLGRRSRFRRTRTGKIIQLTDRDIEILRWLYRYRFLRAPQLVAFLKPKSEKRFIERLGDLYHETGLIDRPKAQWRSFDARYSPIIYELSVKGQKHLEALGALSQRATSLARRGRPGSMLQFDHAMMIVDATVEVELETITAPDQRFVPVDEILERAPDTTSSASKPLAIPVTIRPCPELPALKAPYSTHIVPDGLYGIEYLIDREKRYRFWALECENRSPTWRSKTGFSNTAMKQAAYDALIRSGQHRKVWGIPNLKLRVT
jgi:hypothetical protein